MTSQLRMNEMGSLFRRELKLCGVKEGDKVAILSNVDQLMSYISAFMIAARELGATVFNVNLLPVSSLAGDDPTANVGQSSLAGNRPAIEAIKQADLLVDLTFLLFTKEQLEIREAGTRILLVVEPIQVLARLFPTQDLRERVEAAEARLKNAKSLRFTNRAGTDVTYELGVYPTLTEYGFTDTPGRWDHWPSGFLATSGKDDGVNGRVVMDRGDIIYPFKTYVREPVEFTVRDGMIVSITGGADAQLVSDYMTGFQDPKAYAVSHIGWGLNERAQWSSHALGVPGIGMDGRAYYGNVLFSTGPNSELGGTNDTPCHFDLPMKNCTLYLDDELIVKDGKVIPSDMRAPGR